MLWGLGLQIVFAFLVMQLSFGEMPSPAAGDGVTRLLSYAFAGS